MAWSTRRSGPGTVSRPNIRLGLRPAGSTTAGAPGLASAGYATVKAVRIPSW
jgi:hypothetical protein